MYLEPNSDNTGEIVPQVKCTSGDHKDHVLAVKCTSGDHEFANPCTRNQKSIYKLIVVRERIVQMVKVLPLLDCFALLVVPSISLRHCSFCKLLRSLGPREQVTITKDTTVLPINGQHGGVEGKTQVDKVIGKCASMQNLHEAIATYRNSILRQPDEMKREPSQSFFVEYVERYYF
ncbi:hypothetical protein JHK82_034052 [Glycine max]|nr:hypothetical protein JHK82_034052 [Glycine max]